jgi:flagellar biosynthesis/type III secretory pathway protein FliH
MPMPDLAGGADSATPPTDVDACGDTGSEDRAHFVARPVAGVTPVSSRTFTSAPRVQTPWHHCAASIADEQNEGTEAAAEPDARDRQADITSEKTAADFATDHAAVDEARARADGFAAGLEAGRRQAEAQYGATLDEIANLARSLIAARAIDPDALIEPLLDALMATLAAILEENPRLARDSLRPRALGALARVGEAARPGALLLNPSDMGWARAQIAASLADEGVALVADDSVAPGGFRLRAGPATVEDVLSDRLDRLAPEARALLSAAVADCMAAETAINVAGRSDARAAA